LGLLTAVLAAVGYAGASILQSAATDHVSSTWALARSPRYLAGLALDVAAWALSLVALRRLPVYEVQAVLATSLAFTVLLARLAGRGGLSRRDLAAVLGLVPALAVLGFAGREQAAPSVGPAVTWSLTVLGVVAVAAAVADLAWGRRPAPAALLAGLNFSATALAARAVRIDHPLGHTLLHPLVWVVAATGIAGTAGYATALERGPVGPATAQLWAVEVVVPAVVAIPLLGDSVRPGWWPAAAAAVAVVVALTVVLAVSPASQLEATQSG
jgi:drug/metabolite transporter (DMT)-like permease